MTTYVLGAGASHNAGYPLANTMAAELLAWMKSPKHDPDSYAARYPATASFIEESFGPIGNIEDLISAIQKLIEDYEHGTVEQRSKRTIVANEYGVFQTAVRAWFAEIQHGPALQSSTYRNFARTIVSRGDFIITFNYDVSLDRELKLAEKFEIGDGYGFPIESLPIGSATKLLKLHGSTNWLALLFGGITSGPVVFTPGNTLGSRPVIPKNELSFLGYTDMSDSKFGRGGAALPVMIFPARSKDFYFSANTGVEYAQFWNDLWRQAYTALQSSNRIVICGYSLLAIDERARSLLLNSPKKNAEIVIASGGDTDRIIAEYQNAGHGKVYAAEDVWFETWVTRFRESVADAR
ncbi:MAG TPA: hypothetical protein VKZ53_12405 [Candidatus Angelobacter sp.]|nr:hypothetical protein [Candidatus Angelobacter sp.]